MDWRCSGRNHSYWALEQTVCSFATKDKKYIAEFREDSFDELANNIYLDNIMIYWGISCAFVTLKAVSFQTIFVLYLLQGMKTLNHTWNHWKKVITLPSSPLKQCKISMYFTAWDELNFRDKIKSFWGPRRSYTQAGTWLLSNLDGAPSWLVAWIQTTGDNWLL